jgi:hypothetical protein
MRKKRPKIPQNRPFFWFLLMFWSTLAQTYPENTYARTPTIFENGTYFSIPSTFTPTEFPLFVGL